MIDLVRRVEFDYLWSTNKQTFIEPVAIFERLD